MGNCFLFVNTNVRQAKNPHSDLSYTLSFPIHRTSKLEQRNIRQFCRLLSPINGYLFIFILLNFELETNPTDIAIISAIAQGKMAELGLLYDRHIERVFNTALHFLQNENEAEEIAQDVFVEVVRSAKSFRQEAKVSTWLYRITSNKCLDVLRKRKTTRSLKMVFSIFSEESELQVPDLEHPALLMERSEQTAQIFAALKQLNDRQHEAFVLRYFEDLGQKEIAEIMQVSEKSVEGLLQRAKVELRTLLKNL
jgi:RNA polymerase sigma factor (sigma-70 family)